MVDGSMENYFTEAARRTEDTGVATGARPSTWTILSAPSGL